MKQIKPASARNANIALQILISLSLLYSFYQKLFFVPYSKKIFAVIWIVQLVLLFMSKKKSIHIIFSTSTIYLLALHIYMYYIVYGRIFATHSVFYTLIALIIAYLLVEDEMSELVVTLPFIIISIFVFYVVLKGIRTFDNNDFFNMNRNTLSVFLLSYGILIDTIRYKKRKKRSLLWIPTIILSLSLLSRSRTGILISAFYLLLVLARNGVYLYQNVPEDKKRLFLFLIILIYTVILALLMYLIFAKTRFASSGFSSSGRNKIYETVFSELSVKKLLTGFRSGQFDYQVSLHNSYLQLITTGGLGGIIILLLYLFLEMILLANTPYLFLISGLFFLYSLPESIMFFHIGDFALMPLMALAISYLRKRKDKAAG